MAHSSTDGIGLGHDDLGSNGSNRIRYGTVWSEPTYGRM